MPPIPIYAQSPINAAKASGVTPQTDEPAEGKTSNAPPATTSAATLAGAASGGPPAARPGAVPRLPRPTGVPQISQPVQPTPTADAAADASPPPPQPGAVPVPSGRIPPTGGQAAQVAQVAQVAQHHPKQAAVPTSAADGGVIAQSNPYPPQTAIPPLTSTYYPPSRGTSTSEGPHATTGAWPSIPRPTGLFNEASPAVDERNLDHPPGYVQNTYAADMNSSQRAAAAQATNAYSGGEDAEGVWDAAKKLAKAAGDRLSAAETEVWRRINSKQD